MQIYLARNNVQAGPYSLAQLNSMLAAKEVHFDDLIWHVGMDEWQRVGDVTNNQYNYQPKKDDAYTPIHQPTDQRTTVEQLFGNRPINTEKPKKEVKQHHVAHVTTKNTNTKLKKQVGDAELASPISRIIATFINFALYAIAMLPAWLILKDIIDVNQIQAAGIQTVEEMRGYYFDTIVPQVKALPQTNLIISNILILGLLIIQMALITTKGQSIGKLAMGIRVVDTDTKKLPKWSRRVLIRTILLFFVYLNLMPISILIIVIHYLVVIFNRKNRKGLHDFIARTIVVKANENQLNK